MLLTDLVLSKGYRSYLEIGVATGETINEMAKIPGLRLAGVDPTPLNTHVTDPVDSDTFFERNTESFDLVFIDGCHLEPQVDRDVANALASLNEGGTIVMHDSNPATPQHAGEVPVLDEWNGTVWRSVVRLRCTMPSITVRVINVDYGCAVLTVQDSEVYEEADLAACLTWGYFDSHRRAILNLTSYREFLRIYVQ